MNRLRIAAPNINSAIKRSKWIEVSEAAIIFNLKIADQKFSDCYHTYVLVPANTNEPTDEQKPPKKALYWYDPLKEK